jgi:hypothetical protein
VAIGALVGVGVLIAAGIYIPRRVGTHADPDKASQSSGSTSGPSTTPASTTAPADSGPVSIRGENGSVTVDEQGNVDIHGKQGSISTSSRGVKVSTKGGANAQPSGGGQGAQVTSPAPPAAPAAPAGPSPEEIAQMEDEADKLNARGSTITQSVEALRRQQVAAGYNLRGDMASAEERMQLYLSKGNDKLKAQDLVGAKKYFDMAETEIEKLEKFMGR